MGNKRLDGIYRGYDIFEKDEVWKIELEGKTIKTFDKIPGVSGKATCMCEIDAIKREETKEVNANVKRVDAQVKLDKNVKATRNGGV